MTLSSADRHPQVQADLLYVRGAPLKNQLWFALPQTTVILDLDIVLGLGLGLGLVSIFSLNSNLKDSSKQYC